MTNLEAKQALARKLNIDYADIANNDLFSDADLQDYINTGGREAYDADFWDFAEHSKTATLDATAMTNGYVAYPPDFQPSSIYYLTINGKEFDKKNFTSFKRYFQENTTATDKYWAEFKRLLFFNVNAASAGQAIDVYGKRNYRVLSADADLLPFSPDQDNEEMSGNNAIILLAYSEALSSEKKKNPTQAKTEREKAFAILTILSNQLKQGRALEQSKNRPMFNVPNFFGRNTGSSGTGTFNI